MHTQLQPALDFLGQDILRNIVLLKMLSLFPNAIECHYREEPAGAGVLLLLPTQASPYDRQVYPSTKYVVLISAASQALVRRLLSFVPRDAPLVFKLLDDADRRTVAQEVARRRATAFFSYTAPADRRFMPAEAVHPLTT